MKKKYLIVGGIFILFVLIMPISLRLMVKDSSKKVSILNHKKVEGLYVKNDDLCTDVPSGENINLFIVFGQMKKDNVLADSIDMDTYKNEARKVVKDVTEDINYTYEGYKYTKSGNKIVRQKSDCENNYVSKLYGYSQGDDKLYLTITSGYVRDGKVYDINGKEIGEYSKDSLNKVLDNGTMKNYIYMRVGNDYKFEKIED